MAGGTFTVQNKVRPGVYVNFESAPKAIGTLGERGIATLPLKLSWGPSHRMIRIEAGEDPFHKLGYNITEPELLLVKETLKRARAVWIYRLNTGAAATAVLENLTVTARHGGTRGNDITITVSRNIDNAALLDVRTLLRGKVTDTQTVSRIDELGDNDWVLFQGTGELAESAGVTLTGGTDEAATNQDYMEYLAAAEVADFHTMALPVADTTLKGIFVAFCKRMRETEGKKIQIVLEDYPNADYEGIISVGNGVMLADGTILTPAQCTAWTAGAAAAANISESLTYAAYEEAVDAIPRYTHTQIVTALQRGEFIFTINGNKVVVEQDVNTLTSFTASKGKAFGKNRVIRVLDSINNDFTRIFSNFYLGKIHNNDDGRNLLKNECINYLEMLQGIGAIQNFVSQTDIEIRQGAESDSVYAETYVTPVDAVEKIYMKVQVG